MGILDNYLQELFGIGNSPEKQLEKIGFVDPNDKSLPNPYNFRQLKLDPKITKEDIKKADVEWRKIIDKGWTHVDTPKEGFEGIINKVKNNKKNGARLYVIVDKGKRVGIVGITNSLSPYFHYGVESIYVTWVRGKNYATSGMMKMLNLPDIPQYHVKGKELLLTSINIDIDKENLQSISVARNLKAKLKDKTGWKNSYEVKSPYWWNNNKLLKHTK
jgi:hypothetical protein